MVTKNEIDLLIKNAEELLTLPSKRSEIVGLIPLGVLEDIAKNYLKYPQFSIHQIIEQRILEFE